MAAESHGEKKNYLAFLPSKWIKFSVLLILFIYFMLIRVQFYFIFLFFIRSELVRVDPSWSDQDWRSELIRSDFCTCLLLITIHSSHLQLTITNVLLKAFPQKLLASHLYSPASLLLTLISERMLPSVRSPVLTSVQDTDGIGVPLTWQVKELFSPSITVMLIIACIKDASTSKGR